MWICTPWAGCCSAPSRGSGSASGSLRSWPGWRPACAAYNRAPMRRNAPTILALLLIVATATAFAVTQRLKLEPSPISRTRVSDAFSPVCRCASKAANIEFSLRRADDLRIAVRVGSGEVIIAGGPFAQGDVHVRWDGRDASGEIVPDGTYYPLVHLERAGRTIDL